MNLVEINTAFEQQGWTEIVATLISKPLVDEDLAVAIMGSPHSSIKLGLFACIDGMSQFSDRLARDFSFYPFYRQSNQPQEFNNVILVLNSGHQTLYYSFLNSL